jgi:hypothetical protein
MDVAQQFLRKRRVTLLSAELDEVPMAYQASEGLIEVRLR